MIHFITALHCEARPIIERYGLKAAGNHGRVALYSSDNASLAVSGVGLLQSAIATTALKDTSETAESDVWMNIGVCGHRSLPIGEAILANRVSSPLHRESLYPRLLAKSPFVQTGIETIPEPTSDYPENDAVEMEAYGFFQACLHFTTLERAQAIKIVSDNANQNAERTFNKDWISQMVANHLDKIESFAQELHGLVRDPESKSSTDKLKAALLSNHHYSVTEQHHLQSRLEKLAFLLTADELPDPSEFATKTKAGAAEAIEALINDVAVDTRK